MFGATCVPTTAAGVSSRPCIRRVLRRTTAGTPTESTTCDTRCPARSKRSYRHLSGSHLALRGNLAVVCLPSGHWAFMACIEASEKPSIDAKNTYTGCPVYVAYGMQLYMVQCAINGSQGTDPECPLTTTVRGDSVTTMVVFRRMLWLRGST